MTPMTLLLLMLGAVLGLAWGLHSLIEKSEDVLGDLLAWPSATRSMLPKEEPRP